jgi:hypothetical protein
MWLFLFVSCKHLPSIPKARLFLFVSCKYLPSLPKACGCSCLCPVNTCLPYLKYESCSCRKHLQYHYFITFAINFMPFLIMAFMPCSCYPLNTLFSLSITKVSKNTRSSECGVCSTVGMFSAKNSSHIVMTYPVTLIMTSVALICSLHTFISLPGPLCKNATTSV